MKATIKLVGFDGLEEKLGELKSATAKNKMRKVLRIAGKPIADKMVALAPVDEGDLRESITVSPLLNRSQRRRFRKGYFADLEMHIGPSGLVQGIVQEFGTFKMAANPFGRPAWEGLAEKTLTTIGKEAWAEVSKVARRR